MVEGLTSEESSLAQLVRRKKVVPIDQIPANEMKEQDFRMKIPLSS
jgi:hypothetical protein